MGWTFAPLSLAASVSLPATSFSASERGLRSPILDMVPRFLIIAVMGISWRSASQTSALLRASVGRASLGSL